MATRVQDCLKKVSDDMTSVFLAVRPGGKKTEVLGFHGPAIKLRVAAPPVDGKANLEVVHWFAKTFGIRKSRIEIVSGVSSKKKVVHVNLSIGVVETKFLELTRNAENP